MQPLQVDYGETWTVFRRGPRDRTGDSAFVENGEIEDCVFDEQPPEEITGGREAAAYGGNLYVPKALTCSLPTSCAVLTGSCTA